MLLKVAFDSRNKKLYKPGGRAVVATYLTQDSCPTSCPFLDNGCYGEYGVPGGRPVDHAARAKVQLTDAIDQIITDAPRFALVRHHVVGDLMVNGDQVNWDYIDAINTIRPARRDLEQILITHAWRHIGKMPFNFAANASVEDADGEREATALGWQITRVYATDQFDDNTVLCPATQRPDLVGCNNCLKCARPHNQTVAFLPHGSGRRKLAAALAA